MYDLVQGVRTPDRLEVTRSAERSLFTAANGMRGLHYSPDVFRELSALFAEAAALRRIETAVAQVHKTVLWSVGVGGAPRACGY